VAFRFRRSREEVAEARRAIPASQASPSRVPERAGFAYGVPRGGLDEHSGTYSGGYGSDRRTQLDELFDAYMACPWAWACVQAIAKTITAGGLVMDWGTDTGDGDQEAPAKPASVLAAERLFEFTNPRQNIRQLLRNVVVDLLVFGDAFIEVTWWGNLPVALYNLDSPSTTPVTDEHGQVSKYVQLTEQDQRAEFDVREVIHISLDSPRSGAFGVSPTRAALLPITAWLHAAATGKEMFRKGLPPTVHADFPAGKQEKELTRWRDRIFRQNIGPRNIGAPWITQGGATLKELQSGKVSDVLAFLNQKRDEIIADYGVPPAKVSVIESGNLGGGTGVSQDRTFRIDTCAPIAELVLEAVNFAIIKQGFGIEDWHAKFRDVDYRSSKEVEDIRDERIRNGTWTINRARADVGEPPVEGGDDAVIVDRQNMTLVRNLARLSDAAVSAAEAGAPVPDGSQAQDGPPAKDSGSTDQGQDADQAGQDDGKAAETVPPVMLDRYRRRLAETLTMLAVTESKGSADDQVYDQMSRSFPPSALKWVKDTDWSGPREVPVGKVDTRDQDQWNASKEPGEVDRLRAKLRRKTRLGRRPKPVILIDTGKGKLVIADGHHHFLAERGEGLDYTWAFIGKVGDGDRRWETLATSERRTTRKAA
jgi:HK97 family phage portal protein